MQNNLEFINPPEAGKHPGFSHGVKVQCGSLLFVAGQVGWDEAGRIVSFDFVGQFDKALSNVLAVVRQAGGEPASIVRLRLYVLDRREYMANLKPLGKAYQSRMGKKRLPLHSHPLLHFRYCGGPSLLTHRSQMGPFRLHSPHPSLCGRYRLHRGATSVLPFLQEAIHHRTFRRYWLLGR